MGHLYKKNTSKFSANHALKTCFSKVHFFQILMDLYTNSLGQYFDKLSLNAASCQTADSTDYVCISIELELKDLNTTSS